jgi:hypothetical protein
MFQRRVTAVMLSGHSSGLGLASALYCRPMADEAPSLEELERIARRFPQEIQARTMLYQARRAAGLPCPLTRPRLPLPPRPQFIAKLDLKQHRPHYVGKDWKPCDAKNEWFMGFDREPVPAEKLAQIHNYIVAICGHDKAFAAWAHFGVKQFKGAEIARGIVLLVVEHVELMESRDVQKDANDDAMIATSGLDASEWLAKAQRERAEWETRQEARQRQEPKE